ncbi:hypothetical protein [Sulfurovum sp. NBC37-1]|uniref:hypothetical protein n=1 Tax=Sulfurovum sp. (strain NBC37-1) TaxID=387093 RepID=UPI00015879AA|nr:hypothetical protein [Sulfurovum sp. NBC37-1]BAF72956.1 hypothetical protein SUN_2014 [Sulfurovum sp. NBC37-1]
MCKQIFGILTFIFLVSSTVTEAKEYPILALGVQSVRGSHIGRWERERFLDGLEKELNLRGHIELHRNAPFLMKVQISGYSTNFGRSGGKFLGRKQYRFKQNVRLRARYEVFDRRGYELYHGNLSYNVRMDTGSSISYEDAMMKARESMLEGLGERVGSRINDRFHFMVDFEDQMYGQYGEPKSKKNVYGHSGSARLPSGSSLDFESGKVSRKNSWGDLKWEALPGKVDMHFFNPLKKSRFAMVKGKSYNSIDKSYVKRKKLSGMPLIAFDFDRKFSKGSVFVFKTTEGHYGKMQILGFRSKGAMLHHTLRLKWILF